MKKSAILLAAALIAVAVFNFYTGTKHTGNAEQSGVLDEITTKMVLLLQKDGGGPASVQGQSDVKDSPYFKKVDVYNMKSGGSLLLLEACCFWKNIKRISSILTTPAVLLRR